MNSKDTDPLQAEILLLLAADDPSETDWRRVQPIAGKLFLVGDPKQSIYRFRRADVELYEQVRKSLVARGAELLHLTTSFRAVPSIQSFVNAESLEFLRGIFELLRRDEAFDHDLDREGVVVFLVVPPPEGLSFNEALMSSLSGPERRVRRRSNHLQSTQ